MHEAHNQDLLHRCTDYEGVLCHSTIGALGKRFLVGTVQVLPTPGIRSLPSKPKIDEATSAHSFVNVDASGVQGVYCQKATDVAISSSCLMDRDGI